MKRINDGYMDIDCLSNAIDNLKKAEHFLLNTDDPFRWKWASIALSGALYGFMIYALGDTNYHDVLDFSKMKKPDKRLLHTVSQYSGVGAFLAAETIRDRAKSQGRAPLISFNIALQRVQDSRYMSRNVFANPIQLSDSEKKNVFKLRSVLRNNFEHLQPVLWSIEELYFIWPMRDTTKVIERVLRSGMIWPPRRRGALALVKRIRRLINAEEKTLLSNTLSCSGRSCHALRVV